MIKRNLLAIVAICLAAVLVGAPATQAKPNKPKNVPTKLTLKVDFVDGASGKVKSAKKCRGNRKVELYEFTFGPDGGASKVGQTKSKSSGAYALDIGTVNPAAEYEAVTFPVKRGKAKCGGANSPRAMPSGGPIQLP